VNCNDTKTIQILSAKAINNETIIKSKRKILSKNYEHHLHSSGKIILKILKITT